MTSYCPYCVPASDPSASGPKIIRVGFFKRKSDCRVIQRFRCLKCSRGFSQASEHPCFGQNKRQVNHTLRLFFASGISQRRAAYLLNISRTTVVRKFLFLAQQARLELEKFHQALKPVEIMEFDDLETFEHSKFKPLSVPLAVESGTRRILGFEVARMPAKGKLAALSRKKYGPRPDERYKARQRLFQRIKPWVANEALIKSDQNPHYEKTVKKHFPKATYETHKGRRGCVVGQGELKKIGFDPLFSLNHTCAMLRANINRLFRRTWCTTNKPERLEDHIYIYAAFHNSRLKAFNT